MLCLLAGLCFQCMCVCVGGLFLGEVCDRRAPRWYSEHVVSVGCVSNMLAVILLMCLCECVSIQGPVSSAP